MKQHLVVNENGKEELKQASGKSMRQIDRYLSGEVTPPANIGYKMALACRCTHKEALALASEEPEATKAS